MVPGSKYKIDQVIKETKIRVFGRVMIISLDARGNSHQKHNRNKLKIINSKVILNASDSKEDLNKNK